MAYLRTRRPKPDRRTVAKSLRELERLFGDIPKRKAASWQGNAALQNNIDDDILPPRRGGGQ